MAASGAYTVEVLGYAEDLMYMMDEVRQWRQDNCVYAPHTEFYWVSETLLLRVSFNTYIEAISFSRSFEGRLLEAQAAASSGI
jgi:hypothetical protein